MGLVVQPCFAPKVFTAKTPDSLIAFHANKNSIFISNKNSTFISNKNSIFISNKNSIFIGNKNSIFISNKNSILLCALTNSFAGGETKDCVGKGIGGNGGLHQLVELHPAD